MSEVKKTIQLNPELLRVTNKNGNVKSSKKHTQKRRPVERPNPLKKELMNKIKEHAGKHNRTLKNKDKTFESTFEEHLDYLSTLSKRQKVKIHTELPNELQKNNVETQNSNLLPKALPDALPKLEEISLDNFNIPPEIEENNDSRVDKTVVPVPVSVPVSVSLPTSTQDIVISKNSYVERPHVERPHVERPHVERPHVEIYHPSQEPKYGNLKSGNKPTFREWQNKTRKNRPIISKPHEMIQEVKSKYRLGKSKKTRKVSIFLKNKKTRRKIQDEMALLKKKPIEDIKEYLRKHNMIKTGSNAPHDVLRQLYQEHHLAGNIQNKSNDTIIHNYLAEEEEK